MSLEQIDTHEHKRNVDCTEECGWRIIRFERNRAIPDIEKLSSRNFGL